MRHTLSALAAVATIGMLTFAAPARATDRCAPLPELEAQASALNGTVVTVYEGVDVSEGFIAAYTNAIGAPVPADSHPRGLMFVTLGEKTWFALIEPGNCAIYAKVIPTNVHKAALDLATTGI